MSVPDGPRRKKEQKLRHLKKSDDKVFLKTNIYPAFLPNYGLPYQYISIHINTNSSIRLFGHIYI